MRKLLFILSFLILAPHAFSLGGDDAHPGTQVNSDSKTCSDGISDASLTYIDTRTNAIENCFSSYIACDASANATIAKACRAALLIPNTGACAEGFLEFQRSAMLHELSIHQVRTRPLITRFTILLMPSKPLVLHQVRRIFRRHLQDYTLLHRRFLLMSFNL